MAIEIADFPSYKMVDLSIATLNYQKVHPFSYGFPMVFPLKPPFSYGKSLYLQGKSPFSYGFPMVFGRTPRQLMAPQPEKTHPKRGSRVLALQLLWQVV